MAKKFKFLHSKSGNYWLVKSEPEVFSIDDLILAKNQTTHWDGVRNYQARNTLRDQMKLGDKVLYYHSNAQPSAVVGIAEVVKTGYADHTAFDPADPHFDPKSDPKNPTWFMVDIKFCEKFIRPIDLAELRQIPQLSHMVLLQKGSRLSVQPVRPEEFAAIVQLAQH